MTQTRSAALPRTVKRAVILAAGMGTRLGLGPDSDADLPKPLIRFGGRPLVLWILEAVQRCGIEHATLIVGWRGEVLADFAASEPVPGLKVDVAWNDEWRKSNGVSLLKARDVVDEPFVLLMSDHVFEDGLLLGLLATPLGDDEVVLAVDSRVDAVFDLDDATKVRTASGGEEAESEGRGASIVAIGKELTAFDAIDCGLFLCQPAVFTALTEARDAQGGDCSLSDGMRRLAADSRFRAHDIGDAFWQDVDTPAMFAHAEKQLARLRG